MSALIKNRILNISMAIVLIFPFVLLLSNMQNIQNEDDNFMQDLKIVELKINRLICDNETTSKDECKRAFEVFKNTFGHENISQISNEKLIELYGSALVLYQSDIDNYKHLGRISIKEIQQAILIRMDDIAGRVRRERNRRENDWLILKDKGCS